MHGEWEDNYDDPSHPIPSTSALDVEGIKKGGGADLIIVIARRLAQMNAHNGACQLRLECISNISLRRPSPKGPVGPCPPTRRSLLTCILIPTLRFWTSSNDVNPRRDRKTRPFIMSGSKCDYHRESSVGLVYRNSSITSINPTIFALNSGRSSAGIQYSVCMAPPTVCI